MCTYNVKNNNLKSVMETVIVEHFRQETFIKCTIPQLFITYNERNVIYAGKIAGLIPWDNAG